MGSTLGKAGSPARPGIAGPGRPGGLGWARDVTAVAKFIDSHGGRPRSSRRRVTPRGRGAGHI